MNLPFLRPLKRPRQTVPAWLALPALLALSVPAAAQIAGTLLAPDTVNRATALAVDAAKAVAPPGARVLATPGALDARLTLAPCSRIEPYLTSGVPAWGRTRVGLRCTEGAVRWNVFLPVTVQVWAPALVSNGALPAGAKVTEAQLVLADTDWAAASQPPFAKVDVLTGRTLARAVAAGQALRPADLQARQWFALGDVVQVRVVSASAGSGFAIDTEGTAVTPGIEGQDARVRVGGGLGGGLGGNTNGSRIVTGRAVGERRLEIAL